MNSYNDDYKTKKNIDKDYNYGIGLLRIWMSFEVVLMHFWKGFEPDQLSFFEKFLYENEIYAVPVFMILALFYFEETAKIGYGKDLQIRIIRIGVPLWGWGIIYTVAVSVLSVIKGEKSVVNGSDFLWQIGLGTSEKINPTMYFMFDLMLISILAYVIGHIFERYWKTGWYIFFVIGLSLQFIPQIIQVFNKEFEIFVLGRIIEMLPFAGAGLIIRGSDALAYLRQNKKFYCVVFIALYFLSLVFPVFTPNTGFGYSGIGLTVQGTFLVLLFYLVPACRLSDGIKKIIRQIAERNLGVYCVHWGIGKMMSENGEGGVLFLPFLYGLLV